MASSNMTLSHMRELFSRLAENRKRRPINPDIIKRVNKELDKLDRMPLKTKKGGYDNLFWADNPYGDNKEGVLTIDLPVVELDHIEPVPEDFINKAVFYDEKKVREQKIKYVKESCIITYKGEIMIVYITSKDDPAISKALEKIAVLQEQVAQYYPVKSNTFYTPYKLTGKDATKKDKADATKFKAKQVADARYTGKNWMDGMIRYFNGAKNQQGGTMISYQPRSIEAYNDEEFLFNMVYTFSALYSLEKRYAPNIAKYRYELAKKVGFIGAFPKQDLERHCATGLAITVDFASAIHNDSGLKGMTETIAWVPPTDKKSKQYFISPTIKLVFDLTNYKTCILQPPRVPHSTLQSGFHTGVGLVNITKANLVADTELTTNWYKIWKQSLG